MPTSFRRCSQAGSLVQAGRVPAVWQVNRFGPVEYARSDRFGGGGTCSGSSAARGLRGEMGGLSLIEAT